MFSDSNLFIDFLIFCALFLLLFIFSRKSIQSVFLVLRSIVRSNFIASLLISIIFFPGTVIHELSHFIMAVLLQLPVHKLSVFPELKGNSLRLGYVLYEKKDKVRSVIVGVAPLLTGIGLLWFLYTLDFFRTDFWYIQAIKGYIMFVLSSTMFSSRQDLVDVGYLVPFIVIAGLMIYLFDINVLFFLNNESIVEALRNIMYSIFVYGSIALMIHVVIFAFCRGITRLLHITYYS